MDIMCQSTCLVVKPPCTLTYLGCCMVRSKAVVLLFTIHCLFFVLLFSTLCPPSFAIILMGKRELVA